MKSEKGVTLISLTIYIIVMTVVVSAVSIISTYFFTNYRDTSKKIDYITEYTKFNSFFTDEVNHSNIKVLECNNNYIVFDDGVQYSYIPENKAIYRNKVKICSGVESCNFEYKISNGKAIVKVSIQINKKNQVTTYTLKS